jgi:hypothetical protein
MNQAGLGGKSALYDQRKPEQLSLGGMTGGDRMLHHGYAPRYAQFLAPFVGEKQLTVAEFGVLKGTGLAIWCDLFPDARVIGFDIDLTHVRENRDFLVSKGAFTKNEPELQKYDQLVDGSGRLQTVLCDSKLDVVIDDGLHFIEAIVTTWRSVQPFLAAKFVYFIED